MIRRIEPGLTLLLATLTLTAVMVPANGQDAPKQNIDPDQAIQNIRDYEFGQSREPLSVVSDLVKNSLESPEKRNEMASKLAALLDSDATRDCKLFVCRKLALIGTAAQVPQLAGLLDTVERADMARYALERIPGPEASKALLNALPGAPDEVKIGIINSLGERQCKRAVGALAPLVTAENAGVAEAAVSALGKIGGPKAVEVLAAAQEKLPDALEAYWADAYLLCADKLLEQDKKPEAVRIYKAMYKPGAPASIRVAAFCGLVKARGADSVELVTEALTGKDPALKEVATSVVRDMPGTEATKTYAAQLNDLPPDGRVRLLAALADRGDSAALPAVKKLLNSDNEEVRLAAIRATARLGDASCVGKLAAIAAEKGPAAKAAADSLHALTGPGVDGAILNQMKSAKPAVLIQLIEAVVERDISDTVQPLLRAADSPDNKVRMAAYEALGKVGDTHDIVALVDRLINIDDDAVRRAAEKALVAVARRAPEGEKRIKIILAMLSRPLDVEKRCSLLRVLGEVGESASLDELRAAARDDDAAVRDAAVRALTAWPTPVPADDLLRIAKQTDNATHRILALRGYARMLGMPSDRSPEEAVDKYKQALDLATRVEEKKAVLAGLANVRSPDAIDLVLPLMKNNEIKAEAVTAALELAQNICAIAPDKAKQAATEAARATENDSLRKQARKIIDTVNKIRGFITAWEVSGPYTKDKKPGSELLDVPFAPEKDPGKVTNWQAVTVSSPDKPWLINLDKIIGGDNRIAYLRTTVVSDKPQKAQVRLGSDDGVKVWLNGELVHANNAARGCNPGDDKFEVSLEKGPNPVLVKVTNGGGDWAFCMELVRPDGEALSGIEIEVSR